MSPRDWRTPVVVLACGAAILTLSMGSRQTLGLFLLPMSQDFGWGRSTFAFAMALSNLLWGALQPFVGAVADRHGAGRVTAASALLFAASLALMAHASNPWVLDLSAGLMLGAALSGTTFSVILGVVGRAFPLERRSTALGIATAGSSFGQFAMLPLTNQMIASFGWQGALYGLAVSVLVIVPLAAAMVERHTAHAAHGQGAQQSLGAALSEATRHSGFWYLTAGYFVCGFHVAFIQVHLPAYLLDSGLPASVGALGLALIGLFNIAGSFLAGWLGGRASKKHLLSGIYLARGVVIALFLWEPLTPASVYLFAAGIGFLWLGTVPLTTGLVAQIFGVRHLAVLSGIVFFSHQVGAFLGVWLGGFAFDATGSYRVVWLVAIGLAVLAGLVSLPIDQRPVRRVVLARGGAGFRQPQALLNAFMFKFFEGSDRIFLY
jgi:MFS family permease